MSSLESLVATILSEIRDGFVDTFLRWSSPPRAMTTWGESSSRLVGLAKMPSTSWVVALLVFALTAASADSTVLGLGVGVVTALPIVLMRYSLLVAWRLAFLAGVVVVLGGESNMDLGVPTGAVIILLTVAVSLAFPRRVALWTWVSVGFLLVWRSPESSVALILAVGGGAIFTDAIRSRRLATLALADEQELSGLERARRVGFEERTRIARELHDVVAHHMSIVAVRAESAPYRLDSLTDEVRAEFAEISQAARQSLNEIRSLLGVLRSDGAPRLPQPSLDQLEEMVDATRNAGVEVDVNVRGDRRPIRPAVELTAYRILQESLSNVARHAPGAKAEVWVEYSDDALALVVANPWEGEVGTPGHGITGMSERAAAVGGAIDARRRPDGRFVVEVSLPVDT